MAHAICEAEQRAKGRRQKSVGPYLKYSKENKRRKKKDSYTLVAIWHNFFFVFM